MEPTRKPQEKLIALWDKQNQNRINKNRRDITNIVAEKNVELNFYINLKRDIK